LAPVEGEDTVLPQFMKHRLPLLTILDIPIVQATEEEALQEIKYLAELPEPALVAYVNAHTLELSSQDPEFQKILQQAAIVFNDGIGVSLAAIMLRKPRFPANLNGTDLTPKILELAAKHGWRVFILGAAPGIAEKAVKNFVERNPTLTISGTHSGYFGPDEVSSVINQIRTANTDVLIVGMGNPKQEKWLQNHLAATGAKLGIGVGAFIDFSAGVFPRAPVWMQKLKIEWIFRISQEPKRLFCRYFIGGPTFLTRVALNSIKNRAA
jgi:exopolysaccharide biosynthesis WecB/TagA/CpsF family protein